MDEGEQEDSQQSMGGCLSKASEDINHGECSTGIIDSGCTTSSAPPEDRTVPTSEDITTDETTIIIDNKPPHYGSSDTPPDNPQQTRHDITTVSSDGADNQLVVRHEYRSSTDVDTPTTLPATVVEVDSGHVEHYREAPKNSYYTYHTLENVRYSVTDSPQPDHYNEDRVFVLDQGEGTVLAVFDGHDGDKASTLADEYLRYRFRDPDLLESLCSDNPENVLTALFLETESKFFGNINHLIHDKEQIQATLPKNITSYQAYMFYPDKVARLQEIEPLIAGGTTAVVAVIINGYLYVANVGDSRAVLVRKTSHGPIIEQLSTDHSVDNEEELSRLSALGLDIALIKRNGRLGSQENTRCIGDHSIKKGYVDVDVLSMATRQPGEAAPSIDTRPFDETFQYLILMSDGVYKSLECLTDPPTTDTMPKLLQLIKEAEGCANDHRNVGAEVLHQIEQLHEDTYRTNSSIDPQSPLAVQCRKRDDMSLIVLYFGQRQ